MGVKTYDRPPVGTVYPPAKLGRPLTFETPRILSNKINDYFDIAIIPNIMGLANHLGIHYSTFHDWEQTNHPFSKTIQKAKQILGDFIITNCLKSKLNNAMGIFYMKNVFSWCDVPQENNTGKALDILKSFIDKEQSNTIDITPVKTTAKQVVSHADTS